MGKSENDEFKKLTPAGQQKYMADVAAEVKVTSGTHLASIDKLFAGYYSKF